MAERFELAGKQRAVVRSRHGGDAEDDSGLHRQSPASIARFIANAQRPWFIWRRRVHPPTMVFDRGLYSTSARVFDRELYSTSARHFMAARPKGVVLTTRVLASCDTRHSLSSVLRRARVHLPNGTRIGLAGVGEGDERLTFPSHYQVGEALQSPHWVRFAEPSDGTSAWYVPLDSNRTPKTIVYKNGTSAFECQPIGMKGDWVIALVQPPTQEPITHKRCLDVSAVETPPTPGSASDDSGR